VTATSTASRQDVIGKVRSILARADRTTFEGERANALSLARKLVEKHGLDKWDVGPLCYLIGMGDDPATAARRQAAFDEAMRMMQHMARRTNQNRTPPRTGRTRSTANDQARRARSESQRSTSTGARPYRAKWYQNGRWMRASFKTEANAWTWARSQGDRISSFTVNGGTR
jgi:hypothetical protein